MSAVGERADLARDALLVRAGVGTGQGLVGHCLDMGRVDADHRRANSLESHVDVGPVSMPIRPASSRSRLCGLRIEWRRSASQSALMTEANAEFKRFLT